MPALPGCIISDLYAVLSSTGSMVGLPGTITAKASLTPLFVKQTGGGWLEHANVVVSTSASSGAWTLVLPSQPNSDPNTVTWTISLPDGTVWGGAITAAMVTASLTTPLTLHDLKNNYSWGLVAGGAGGTISAVQGPNLDATTTAIGSVLIDQAPSSGHPISLTVPRLGAASGICDLDSGTKVPVSRLPAATSGAIGAVKPGANLSVAPDGTLSGLAGTVTSVGLSVPGVLYSVSGSPVTSSGTLSMSLLTQSANTVFAGPTSGGAATPTMRALVAADIQAVDASAITTGTLSLARLSGITTTQLSSTAGILGSQLDAAAGITSGQIASVSAATLTGSHNLPDGVLSTNVPLLNTANVFTGAQTVANTFGVRLPTPNFTSVSLATGGSLTVGTTYYYVITALDPAGGETVQSNERSVTPTTGNQTANVNWALLTGATRIRVYRSTTSGNYASTSYYDVYNVGVNGTSTFADTGATATGTGTPPSTGSAYISKFQTVGPNLNNGVTNFISSTIGTVNNETLAIGHSPFDNVSTGAFQSAGNFTLLAMNMPFNINAGFITCQNAATSGVNTTDNLCFTVDRRGGITIGSLPNPVLRALARTPVLTNITSSLSGGILLDNTTYYYVITGVDARGTQTIKSNEMSVTTGNSGSNINSNVLTWSQVAVQSMSWFYVYRSTVSGNYSSVSRYQVMNVWPAGTLTFTDTGAATSTGTPSTGMTTGAASPIYLDPLSTGSYITGPSAISSRGFLNLGSGPFDGATTGFFAGSANGTHLAINASSGFNGNFIDFQVAGKSYFAIQPTNISPNFRFSNPSGPIISFSLGGIQAPQSATTSTSGGTLLDNTAYYYVVAPLDMLGRENAPSAEISVTTGNSGSNTNSNTITGTGARGTMAYKFYRSTVSGNYTSSKYFVVLNTQGVNPSLVDTGAAGTTGTPQSSGTIGNSSGVLLDISGSSNMGYYFSEGYAGANHGFVSIGSGPFDGSTAGKFSGHTSGTHLTINTISGYTGNLIDFHVAGVSKLFVDSSGHLVNGAGARHATSLSPLASLGSIVASTTGGTLLDNTTYYYLVTCLDVNGQESYAPDSTTAQGSVTTGNSGANTNSVTVNWGLKRGAMGYRVYRSTTSGNFTNSKRFVVVGTSGTNPSFVDTGAAGTTATPPSTSPSTGTGFAKSLSLDSGGAASSGYFFPEVSGGGTRNGQVNIGSGPFDNSNTGFFSGSSNSTMLAINGQTGYSGNFIDFQVAGVSWMLAQAKLGASTGTEYGLKITPTVTQTSTAGYTAFLVNTTQSTTGSGVKLLEDLQLGGTSKWKVDNAGNATAAGALNDATGIGAAARMAAYARYA
jgi:fibronectin type 3 domain-containing protein